METRAAGAEREMYGGGNLGWKLMCEKMLKLRREGYVYIYIILVNLFIGEQKWGDWSGCL